jgi:arginyl-tRNA synthetase
MTLEKLRSQIASVVRQELGDDLDLGKIVLSYVPESMAGDFATNAAMVYSKDLHRPAAELAKELAAAIEKGVEGVAHAEVAGPGFVNLTLRNELVAEMAMSAPHTKPTSLANKDIVAEYSDPNPFKVLHVGHLYTSVVGDAIGNLMSLAGGNVHRVNFGGDVGRHVAITMWAIIRELGGQHPEKLSEIPESARSKWMAARYVSGTKAFEEDDAAKAQIIELNKMIYDIHSKNDHESSLAQIYWTCRTWSYEYFEQFYDRIGSHFEKYYPESETASLGTKTVLEQLDKGVYKKSDGAVVFEGEPYGLHTRVFITSQGLPTYEAKDVGLIMTKWQDYHFDLSVVITGSDITDYMKVVLQSLKQFAPELADRTRHITHGNVKLAGGVKMASRKGNFLAAVDVLDLAAEASERANGTKDPRVVLGAVKYAFLKSRIGADLVFIPEESVSLDGNSGPYLQYAYARARTLLSKAGAKPADQLDDLTDPERILALKVSQYPDVLERSVADLLPHYIATYLYELAQTFNRFYEGNRVIGDPRERTRLRLVELYSEVLRESLRLLGIDAPDHL